MSGDQAQRLREFLQQRNRNKQTRVVAITSGKGGVGKSNVTLNFALRLMEKGQKVVVIDLDIGMANIDILMGVSPKFNLFDMVDKNKSIWDILERGPHGLEYIAGGTGFQEILNFHEGKIERFFQQLGSLQGYADTILLDTGAGVTNESLRFLLAADEVLLVTTPEPTAIADAYSMIKILNNKSDSIRLRLIINRVGSYREGKKISDKISSVARDFLQIEVETLGYVMEDSNVMQSVKKQKPFYLAYPLSPAAKGIKELVDSYLSGKQAAVDEEMGMKGFIRKLLTFGR